MFERQFVKVTIKELSFFKYSKYNKKANSKNHDKL